MLLEQLLLEQMLDQMSIEMLIHVVRTFGVIRDHYKLLCYYKEFIITL